MADWIITGIFAVFVLIGTAWMLKTIDALRKRIKKLEEKK